MLGCQDFCGYYEWTFHYLRRRFGTEALQEYWANAIGADAQRHYLEAARQEGLRGLYNSWSKTGAEEQCDWTVTLDEANNLLRLDMRRCPSKGFLLNHDLNADEDYCDHCIGWIGPALNMVGAQVVAHEHNHCGQCWWQIGMKHRPSCKIIEGPEIQREDNWQNGYLHRFEENVPVDEGSDGGGDVVALLRTAFAGFEGAQVWGDNFDPELTTLSSLERIAAIATGRAYLLAAERRPQPRAVVLGHEALDWQQFSQRWNSVPRETRPLLLHPFLPAASPIPFPKFGLPRPLPLLPILIRTRVYTHEAEGARPSTEEFAKLLKLALEKVLLPSTS